jgi:hypothetical protein
MDKIPLKMCSFELKILFLSSLTCNNHGKLNAPVPGLYQIQWFFPPWEENYLETANLMERRRE